MIYIGNLILRSMVLEYFNIFWGENLSVVPGT